MNPITYFIILPGIVLLFLLQKYPINKLFKFIVYPYIFYSVFLLCLISFTKEFYLQIGPFILRKNDRNNITF